MRNSISSCIWRFSATRMLEQYIEELYLPAARDEAAEHVPSPRARRATMPAA
jgi:hypothetical protein